MQTNRRNFFQIMGAGTTGLTLAAGVPSNEAQPKNVAKSGGARWKMIFRADDIGYTKVCNIGAFETIERGVVTAAEVMLDTPGTEDALERLKAFPWVSLGWHTHFWGSPVLKPEQVRSLIINEAGRNRFRKDYTKANDVVFEEALMELRAQIDRCIRILGRAPDVCGPGFSMTGESPFTRAMMQVCKEYGIVTNYLKLTPSGDAPKSPSRWANRNIQVLNPGDIFKILSTSDSMAEIDSIDPIEHLLKSHLDFKENDYVVSGYHPGYVDYHMYRLGDYASNARNFILVRMLDVEALCSDRLKNWIKENRIELSNFRDALYGTKEYQNHLKATGSDLCMI
jgi:chitin disaccharide deacetylase